MQEHVHEEVALSAAMPAGACRHCGDRRHRHCTVADGFTDDMRLAQCRASRELGKRVANILTMNGAPAGPAVALDGRRYVRGADGVLRRATAKAKTD